MIRSRWAIVALLAVPLVEIVLLIYVAGYIGPVATVAVVIVTGLLGLLLVRAEGRLTLRRLNERLVAGEAPTDELIDGGLLIVAGVLLLTPGLVTDGIGFILVIPPTRRGVRAGLKRWVIGPVLDAHTGGFYVGGVSGQPGGDRSTTDLGPEGYDIEIDPDDDSGKGNA